MVIKQKYDTVLRRLYEEEDVLLQVNAERDRLYGPKNEYIRKSSTG